MNKNRVLPLLLIVLIALVYLFPSHNYQRRIAVGDHGRDLYCFEKAMEGQVTYRDYFWVYGPLMPYVYGFFYKMLGTSVLTVQIGMQTLLILSTVLVYLTLRKFVPSPMPLLSSLGFLIFFNNILHTYNHIGGIPALLALIYLISLYIENQKTKYLYAGLLMVLLLFLIKLNIGAMALSCFIVSFLMIEWSNKNPFDRTKKIFLFCAVIVLPLVVFLIYSAFLYNLPPEILRQNLAYFGSDQYPYVDLKTFFYLVYVLTFSDIFTKNPFLVAIIMTSAIQAFLFFIRERHNRQQRNALIFLIIVTIFYLASVHEFLITGIGYRLYWSQPFYILWLYLVIAVALETLTKHLRLVGLLFLFAFLSFHAYSKTVKIFEARASAQYLDLARMKIYVSNPAPWIDVVKNTTAFINDNLKADETFLALPYEPLYYFLTDRTSPTRQLIFFKYLNISEDYQRKIITELNERKVNWIVLSNRSDSTEVGLGTLGKSYCLLLDEYIKARFATVKEYGKEHWKTHHAVVILKRMNPL